jgi:predicted flap endonuclease-1-like 5' DNA nuclease
MASILYLVAGVAIGLLAGWFLGRRQAAKQTVESPAQSEPAAVPATDNAVAAPVTEDTDESPKAGSLNGAVVSSEDVKSETVPVTSGEPTTPLSAETDTVTASTSDSSTGDLADDSPSVGAKELEPVAEAKPEPVPVQRAAEPVAVVEPIAEPEPVPVAAAAPVAEPFIEAKPSPVTAEPVAAEPVAAEPVVTEPVIAEPVVAEPVAAVPGAAEDSVLAEPAPIAVAVQEPDDLTKIAGIGPKTAMALAAGGITTFRQVADADAATLRAAITAAGLRSAPGLATWPEKAKQLVGTAV